MDDNTKKENWQYWDNLPDNEAEKLVEELAQTIHNRKLNLASSLILQSMYPLTRIGSELGLAFLGPYLEFIGLAKHAAIFRKRENVTKLIERIEELEDEENEKKS